MATGGFLHHHLHPRLPFHLAESRYLHPRSSAFNGLPFSLRRSAATLAKRRFLLPTLRSVRCLKQEDQVAGVQVGACEAQSMVRDGSNTEAAEWVNKSTPDPMVEVDPVTVFRRIVAERRARLALAKAKEAHKASQTASPPPFVLGREWTGNSAIAIATALVLLAVAAASYFLRSRKRVDKAAELTSTDGKDNFESSINGRRKLVKDTVKASDSILTAMVLGAASVSRPKGHIDSTHDALHAANGNAVESLIPEGEPDSNLIPNSVATDDLKSDTHGSAIFGQMPYSSSIVEDYAPLKTGYGGTDVTEGPWFGQAADDTGKPGSAEVADLQSEKPAPVVVEELEFDDVPAQSEGLRFSNETAVEQLVNEISVAEARFESPALTSVMDGEFFGEVVSVNVATVQVMEPNNGHTQVDDVMVEEFQTDGVLADNSTIPEELEQAIEHAVKQDLVTTMEGKNATDSAICPEQNLATGSSALDLSYVQSDETELDSDTDASNEHQSNSEDRFEEMHVADRYSVDQDTDFLEVGGQGDATNLLSGADKTSEGIVIEVDDVLDGVNSSVNVLQMGQIEDSAAIAGNYFDEVSGTGEEPSTDHAVATISLSDEASEEISRQESKKALQQAIPAIAIGVGTVGALFGVAGGLQVVGFAAVANFVSHDFFWAQSRESLWQELNGITDRQKLLDFLARRNILRNEQENSSL